jgi:hypothetical protein
MTNIFNFIAAVATFVTALFSTSPKMVAVPWTEADFVQVPASLQVWDNDYEQTLSFTTANNTTLDICHIVEDTGEVMICLEDEYGNLLGGVKIPLATLTSYLQNVAQVPAIA